MCLVKWFAQSVDQLIQVCDMASLRAFPKRILFFVAVYLFFVRMEEMRSQEYTLFLDTYKCRSVSLAQSVERQTFNLVATGSIPVRDKSMKRFAQNERK